MPLLTKGGRRWGRSRLPSSFLNFHGARPYLDKNAAAVSSSFVRSQTVLSLSALIFSCRFYLLPVQLMNMNELCVGVFEQRC